ncbi:MAG: tRNA 2-thiouridine(34) synthase MnmA [Candidatus Manganitrophaceae bacterium]
MGINKNNPARQKRVVVGMSGGVDSAVTAALLKEAGYDVIGVTLTLWKEEGEEEKRWQDRSCCKVGLARHVAKLLSIPHHVVDAQEAFRTEIIDDFCDAYLVGQTPNPCVRCNERMKFGRLLEAAHALGTDLLATGHYARIDYRHETGRFALSKGVDLRKDQSYFLYRLSQQQLASTLFPLGAMEKEEVCRKAAALGLPYEEVLESQEVCFVTQKDYRGFLAEQRPEAVAPGKIVTESGEVLGEHTGVAFYTIGQRRGLGVALGERIYVTGLHPERREVVVGSEESLLQKEVTADRLVWGGRGCPDGPTRIQGKIRYRSPAVEGTLFPLPDDQVRVRFDTPQRGITPGQSLVLYQGEEVIGGGVIIEDRKG